MESTNNVQPAVNAPVDVTEQAVSIVKAMNEAKNAEPTVAEVAIVEPEAIVQEPKVEDKKEIKAEEKIVEKKEEEKPKEEPKKEEKEPDRLAPRFAALSRKEKAIREREIKTEEKAAKFKEVEDLIALSKSNPLAALEKMGLTYEQLTTAILKGDKSVEINKVSKVEEENKALKQQLDTLISNMQNAETKAKIDAAQSKFNGEIKAALQTAGDKFELLNANPDATDIVFNIIDQDFTEKTAQAKREGKEITLTDALTFEQAAEMAEKYLEEELAPYLKTKKFAPKQETKPVVSESKPKEATKEDKPSSPSTLSNSMVNQSPASSKSLTRDEEIAITTKQFTGKLFHD